MLGHAFACGFGRVQIHTDVRNARSQAAITRLGATREGVLRRWAKRGDGSFRDLIVYSILKEEWPSVRAGLEARWLFFSPRRLIQEHDHILSDCTTGFEPMLEHLIIRPLSNDEMPQAVECIVETFGEDWRKITIDEFEVVRQGGEYFPLFFVAYDGDEMVGTIATMRTGFLINCRSISWIGVRPAWRRRGIASRMVETMIDHIGRELFGRKPGTVILAAQSDLWHFYETLGFTDSFSVHGGRKIMSRQINV